MLIRRCLAALTLGALTLGVSPVIAGAASPGMSVPRTTIETGESLAVTITAECTEGEWGYGSINQYLDGWYNLAGEIGEITQRSYKRDFFEPPVSNVFSFPKAGTYTLRNYCGGEVGSIVITVTDPIPEPTTTSSTTTTSTTTSTTTLTTTTTTPSTTTTTTVPATTTTTTVPATTTTPSTTTTTTMPAATTTAPAVTTPAATTPAAVAVAGTSQVRTQEASGAEAPRRVSFTG
ncbi:MAG: hypothetical protein GX868_17480 [Actinobacteria bacterium]|nr:hypothetical protein [Actinomycetota bacterium]